MSYNADEFPTKQLYRVFLTLILLDQTKLLVQAHGGVLSPLLQTTLPLANILTCTRVVNTTAEPCVVLTTIIYPSDISQIWLTNFKTIKYF